MGQVTENISKISGGHPVAVKIAKEIENGKSFDEILHKYAKTPAMKHEIFYYKTQIEKALKAGVPLKEVLDTHFTDENLKAEIHKRVAIHKSLNIKK